MFGELGSLPRFSVRFSWSLPRILLCSVLLLEFTEVVFWQFA
jgi:hypothetical protein